MFIEGIINKHYLKVVKAAGYDIIWEAHTKKELKEKGYSPILTKNECVVRIFLSKDIEDELPVPLL